MALSFQTISLELQKLSTSGRKVRNLDTTPEEVRPFYDVGLSLIEGLAATIAGKPSMNFNEEMNASIDAKAVEMDASVSMTSKVDIRENTINEIKGFKEQLNQQRGQLGFFNSGKSVVGEEKNTPTFGKTG